jgi:hypothetical protein
LHSHPGCLNVEQFQQGMVVLVHQDRSASGGLELHGSAYMVNVGVGYHDLRQLQVLLDQDGENLVNLVTGINNHGLMGLFIADD